jgi:hypothetical protein
VSKHIGQREERDKGVRLVEYTKGARVGSVCFAWNNPRSALWRAKTKAWAMSHGLLGYEQIVAMFGPRWAYHHRENILGFGYEIFVPSLRFAEAAGIDLPREVVEDFGPGTVTVRKSSSGFGFDCPTVEDWREFEAFVDAQCQLRTQPSVARRIVPPEPPRRGVAPGGVEGNCEAAQQQTISTAGRKYSLHPRSDFRFKTLVPRQYDQRPLKI